MENVECMVIGAGVVGLAIARQMSRRGMEVIIVECNPMIGNETSSRNNEVIHAGFMYPPDSLRGRLCRPGAKALLAYCADHHIDVTVPGKLILALNETEKNMLNSFSEFGEVCGVNDLSLLRPEEVAELEPEVHCLAALHSPSTAVLDTHALMLAYQGEAEEAGAVLALNTKVLGGNARDGIRVRLAGEDGEEFEIGCKNLVNAAGLGAKYIAAGFTNNRTEPVPEIYFAKGNFFSLTGQKPFERIVVALTDKAAGGAAFTFDVGGRGKFGPDLEWVEAVDYTVDPARASHFVTAIRQYWEGIDESRLVPDFAGIRPRTWGEKDPPGDWIIEGPDDHGVPGLVNLLGIETPGITASLSISDYVADILMQ